ncbi:MAG: hypothetical protein WCW53_15680 [Syntrophales bacterium]|jgi:hypothetical protein
MKNKLMVGMWRYMFNVPPSLLKKGRIKTKQKMEANLAFMTTDHRRVHHQAVRELPYTKQPLPPESLAKALNLPLERVNTILSDLESHMTFLFRNDAGEVIWAYPVTVEKTPHHVTFQTGETIYAA